MNLTDIDMDSIFESASATGNFIFVDNGWTKCSIGSEVISNLAIKGFKGKARCWASFQLLVHRQEASIKFITHDQSTSGNNPCDAFEGQYNNKIRRQPRNRIIPRAFLMNYFEHKTSFGPNYEECLNAKMKSASCTA